MDNNPHCDICFGWQNAINRKNDSDVLLFLMNWGYFNEGESIAVIRRRLHLNN